MNIGLGLWCLTILSARCQLYRINVNMAEIFLPLR